MPSIEFIVERELPCECLALVAEPFPACWQCEGSGVSWQEIAVTVDYEYSRACRGLRDRYGVPEEPDEPASVEIIATSIPLTDKEEDQAEEKCMEDAECEPDYD
jgi:hypothetical protein